MPDTQLPFEFVETEKQVGRPTVFSELGQTGLAHHGGIIFEEFLGDVKGARGRKIYNEMRHNDPIVGAVVLAIKNLVRQVDWKIEPASDDPKDVEIAEFVESCMTDMATPWKRLISEILSMLVFGWSLFEVTYKRRRGDIFNVKRGGSKFDDNRIGWKDLSIRSQDSLDRWEFDDNGKLKGFFQRPAPDFREIFIPERKFLLFRTTTEKNNPEGESILRKAYRPWYFKKRIEEIEGIGLERDLAGLPLARVPPKLLSKDAGPDEKKTLDAVKKMVKDVRNDQQAGLVLPAMYDENSNLLFDFELLSTRGRRNFDTDSIITRYNRMIAMSALADFIVLGHENVGSFALASSKTKVFSVAVNSYMDEIAEVFNQDALPALIELNGFDIERLPKMTHGDIETIDLEALAVMITAMSKTPLDMTGSKFRTYLEEQLGTETGAIEESEIEEVPPQLMPAEVMEDDEEDEDDS